MIAVDALASGTPRVVMYLMLDVDFQAPTVIRISGSTSIKAIQKVQIVPSAKPLRTNSIIANSYNLNPKSPRLKKNLNRKP